MENIQVDRNLEFGTSKEISCRDCGYTYLVASAALSSTCESCGNIAFHPQFTTETVRQGRAQEELFKPRKQPASDSKKKGSPAATIAPPYIERSDREVPKIDPARIEEISIRNQMEWQLWAHVTQEFHDPNAHLAYLSFVTRNLTFDRASERYKAHRQRFLLLEGEKWQVMRADEMLDRIAQLCTIQFERAGKSPVSEFDQWSSNRGKIRTVFAIFFALFGIMIVSNILIALFF